MDKSLLAFIAVGIAFFYLVTTYVGDIQEKDDRLQNTGYETEHKYDQYYTEDSIGQKILDVIAADPKTQVEAWNASEVRVEFIDLFPDFDTMKEFVKNRVRGEELIQKLTRQINEVESKFFSGSMNAEQAKKALERL